MPKCHSISLMHLTHKLKEGNAGLCFGIKTDFILQNPLDKWLLFLRNVTHAKDTEQTAHCWSTLYSLTVHTSLLLPHKLSVIQ